MNKLIVSIITPITQGRAHFLPGLLDMIAAQDYPDMEHVLVWDDGTVGQKRNLGCDRSSGDIIMHFDSDDRYASDWVSSSVEFLLSSGADVVGLADLIFYDPICQHAWRYSYPGPDWVAGATMCYKKSFWEGNPFQDMQIGEDNKFIDGAKVKAHDYINGFAALVHENNTSRKMVSGSRYTPISYPSFDVVSGPGGVVPA